jgi:hypothetical protein
MPGRLARPLLGLLALASLFLAALGAGAAVAAAGPAGTAAVAKRPYPAGANGGASLAEICPETQTLLLTFADTPRRAAAERRVGDLGRVEPILPEAGIWALSPNDPRSARAAALRRPAVRTAEPAPVRTKDELARPAPPRPPGPTLGLTDRFFTPGLQWGLFGNTGWGTDLLSSLPRPRIAILDTGVDATHEEWSGPASPLVAPRSTFRGDNDASDIGDTGHGTHVAGIAAAPANGLGIVGVAPGAARQAEVIPIQIANAAGKSSEDTMIRGIRHAILNGARVINISAGGCTYSQAFQDTVLWATERGALIVASVGNEGDDVNNLNFPAGYRRVLGVGAQCDGAVSFRCPTPFGVASFSNHNSSVDVIAPGVNVLSSVPRRVTDDAIEPGYALKTGTSMAAPYVSGVAALIMAANPDRLSPGQVMRQIENTATDLPPSGRDSRTGYGVVNARAAVTLTAPADDADEVNDDIKWIDGLTRVTQAGGPLAIEATADRHEDPDDVYAVTLAKGQRLRIVLTHRKGVFDVYLWGPATKTVATGPRNLERNLVRFRGGAAKRKVVVYRAQRAGRHFVDIYARSGRDTYRLTLTKGR